MKVHVTNEQNETTTLTFEGDNFALGLSAVKHDCPRCGSSEFVDGGDTRECPCGLTLVYEDDEAEQLGYLHQREGVEVDEP